MRKRVSEGAMPMTKTTVFISQRANYAVAFYIRTYGAAWWTVDFGVRADRARMLVEAGRESADRRCVTDT